MKTIAKTTGIETEISAADRRMLRRFLWRLGRYVDLPALGRYRTLDTEHVWYRLVAQVCVMGSSKGMAAISASPQRKSAFIRAVAPRSLLRSRRPAALLAKLLREFKATRFPTKSAETLVKILGTPTVYRAGRFVLLDDLPLRQGANAVRDALMDRCPLFGLKSASDFMINVGISRDVIALDVRVIGVLRRYCGFNLKAAQVQGRRRVYLSVEDALRSNCPSGSLALLDRVLFRIGGMSALDFAMLS